MSHPQIFGIFGALLFLGLLFEMVRRGRLAENYSILWFGVGLVFLVFSLKRNLIDIFGGIVGISYSPAAFLLSAVFAIFLLQLHFTAVMSASQRREQALIQRLALLEREMEEMREG